MTTKYNLRKAFNYAVENITMIFFGLISVMLVARIFGPENLGKLSLSQTASGITLFLVTLGLDHIIVRDLVREPKKLGILSTVMIMQFCGWILQIALVFVIILLISDNSIDNTLINIVVIVLVTTYLQRVAVVKYYFQAVNQPEHLARSALLSRSISLFYLFYAISLDWSYELVLLYLPLQALIQSTMLWISFFRIERNFQFDFNNKYCISVLKDALPILASSAIFPLFMQADILLVSKILGLEATGLYSAATRVVTQFVFIGHILTMTFYVALARKVDNGAEDSSDFITGLTKILLLSAAILTCFTYFCADTLVFLLYGEMFAPTIDLLKIVSFAWLFVFPAALFSRLLILKNLTKYELYKSILAAVFSLTSNLLLIPIYGIKVAAYTLLFSYILADLIIYSFFKETRWIFNLGFFSIFELVFKFKKSISQIRQTFRSK